MRQKIKLWLLAILSLTTIATYAQVRIGGGTAPEQGAVLDLHSPTEYVGGLRLPNVNIVDLAKIPGGTGFFSDFTSDVDTNLSLTGMVVYNINATTGKGIYYWDGYNWKKVQGETSINITNSDGDNPFDPSNPDNKNPQDPGSPVFPEAGDTKGPFAPHDEPECTTVTPRYKVEIISGNAYAHLSYTGLSVSLKNMGQFYLTFDANPNAYVRYAVVRVTNNCTTEFNDFLFSQEAASIGVFPNPSQPNVKPEGEDKGPYTPESDLSKCTGDYNITSNQSWCIVTFNPTTGVFSLRYSSNPGLTPRTVTITITKGTCTKSYQVTQDASSIVLTPDPTGSNLPAGGGETTPALPQGSPTCSASPAAYSISLVTGYGYAHLTVVNVATGQFKVKFDTNTSIYPRFAMVRVKDNCTGMTRDFTITQNGQNVGIDPNPSYPSVPAPGGEQGPYTPSTNPEICPNPVYSVSTDQSWCKAVIMNATTGAFKLIFDPNYLSMSRFVNVTVSATNCSISSTYRIEQQGSNVDIGIGNYPASDIPDTGGSTPAGTPNSEIRCNQNPAYIPTLISGNSYATLMISNNQLGVFYVFFSANPSTSPRYATVRVTNPCNGLYTDFTYRQAGADCSRRAVNATGALTQSVMKDNAITAVQFTSLSPINVTGTAPGITISGQNSTSITISGTPSIPGSYSFYASAGNSGCTDESRTFVLTVGGSLCSDLGTPTASGQSICGSGQVTLTASGASAGQNYRWFNASYQEVGTGASYQTATLSAPTTYYVGLYSTSGCDATPQANLRAVTVTVGTAPTVGTITKTSGSSSMNPDDTMQLSIATTGGTWTSTNNAVATVDQNGLVTAVGVGSASIKYTVTGTGACAGNNAVATYSETITVAIDPLSGCGKNGTTGSFTYNSHTYLTHRYATGTSGAMQCWMVSNSVEGTTTRLTGHGGYYTWDDRNTACPSGWRLPLQSEFKALQAINPPHTWWTQAKGGYYYNGTLSNENDYGNWWNNGGLKNEHFRSGASTSGKIEGENQKEDGKGWVSVRCVK